MAFLRQKTAPVREKRAGTVGAWTGNAAGFLKESGLENLEQRIRTFAQDAPSDIDYALDILRTIEGLAVVVHGPAGCAAGLHRAWGPSVPWAVTNLNERDSIMGGDAKLRAAILEIHKAHSPRAVAVVSTPVVAINNDDIDTVAEELREELSIAIIPVYTDGFRSKVGATGQDVASHALVKHLLPLRRREQGTHVNLLSVAESRADVESLRGLLASIGIESFAFPRHSSISDAHRAVEAVLSVPLDPDASEYLGKSLEEAFGIPYSSIPSPVGLLGTTRWLTTLGEVLGKVREVDELVDRETRKLSGLFGASESYRGTKVFVNLPASQAFAFWHLAQELGLEVVGIKVPSIAKSHAAAVAEFARQAPELPILAGDGQAFEEVNVLGKIRPDLYITAGPPPVHALRSGIPVLNLENVAILGFAGLERVARGIERVLGNTALSRFLAEGAEEPYEANWLKKSVHWYIKQEVK
jgi:nitrogenase molybdenum-iron protein alpha/beta subunit